MSDWTPDTEHIREIYVQDAMSEAHRKAHEAEFDRWLATVEAAAKQRGAIKALRDAAESDELIDHMYANLLTNQPIAVRETSKYLHNRADLLESDE